MSARPAHVLPVIVLSQFAGTSLWFAGNAILPDLQQAWGLEASAVASLTSAVQLGFIGGTLLFAVANLADRFPARAVFLVCALLGAASNAAIALFATGLPELLVLRFATGFFLAGIYPVGMKIAASWFEAGLGRALGWLVGALVLGTAFPHLLRAGQIALPWQQVLLGVSALAAGGGLALFALVPAGPHLPPSAPFDARAIPRIFSEPRFRSAAFGYFGHMWELYAFWAFVPLLLASLAQRSPLDVPVWSFVVLAAGAVGCIGGGWVSERVGSARVAAAQVVFSGLCCLLAPAIGLLPVPAALAVLVLWGIAVVGDSPQFSTLNAQTAPRDRVGTALTVVTSIGFFLTIPALQLLGALVASVDPWWALLALAPGPALSVLALRPLLAARG